MNVPTKSCRTSKRLVRQASMVSVAFVLAGCGPLALYNDKPLPTPGGGRYDTSVAPPPRNVQAYRPKPTDFSLEVIETSKKCFGSAGCHVKYEIDVSYVGEPLDSNTTYKVIYSVLGGEDGSEIGSFEVRGGRYEKPREDLISTSSPGTRLSARVTRIIAE